MSNHVFHDPTNRRWRWIRLFLITAAVLSAVGLSIFAFSLGHIVSLPQASLSASVRNGIHSVLPHLPQRRKTLQQFLRSRTRRQLLAEISREKLRTSTIPHTATPSSSIVAAFYAPWQPASLRSLRANAGHITHLFPAWVHVNSDGQSIDLGDWNPKLMPATNDVMDIADRHDLSVMPVINNAQGGQFDGQRLHILLNDENLQSQLIDDLKTWLERNSFQGVNIDFENLLPEDYQKLPPFIEKVRDDFEGSNLLITADLEVRNTGLDWQRVAEACDFVILMAYDEHSLLSPSGPISSIGWYRDAIDRALETIPRSKLVVGLANYAYDWTDGVQRALPLSYQAALLTAHDSYSSESEIVDFDPDSLNPTFNYTDPDGHGHEVWMLDGVTAANQWRVAQQYRIRGAALWVLGLEDPSVWTVLDRGHLDQPASPANLQQISFPYDIDFIGQGEILKVDASPKAGSRTLEIDEQTGLVVDEKYESFPTSFVIRRSGYQPKMIALTIDDGPAEPYTSEMLDELKRLNVKATFFVVGDNAYRYPDVVDRMYREGHEIGNHTFTHPNVGTISARRARIELNGTQRAIQSITGHSTILFRAPYNADAEPQTPEEVAPLILASDLGYLTVDEFIDPQDWNLFVSFPNGTVERRTAADFAREVLQQVHTKGIGNGVLLHDGGGDRSETVKALPLIVDALRKEGYQFVTVSQLLHSTRDQVMPRADKEMLLMHDDRVVFEFMHWGDVILEIAFVSAIILGTARVIFMVVLALLARRRERKRTFDLSYRPLVSILIAAYNEQKVIGRTIRALLASDFQQLEIVIVDDGSRDETFEEVERLFGDDSRVRAFRQPNNGKASALNRAIENATGEILVCLDADTIFAPDTIEKLVRRFADPAVGAVAGNVKVGNRVNALTRWQSIEYITSQNMDRMAFGYLNAITVVPGAVGAWRRQAVVNAGGYLTDTMAEDMDLTWRIRMAGWRVESENDALAFTEAPDTMRALFKQRFRWAFGTLQCLWKHREGLGKYGYFGRLMMPALWLFQIVYQAISPLVDLQILWTVATTIFVWVTGSMLAHDWQPVPQAVASLQQILLMYLFFFAIELIGSLVAFSIEKESKRPLVSLLWQRIVYRQVMYGVVLKAIKTAFQGIRTGWGKLERKGTVTLAEG